jgi:hypothetical protein
MIGTRKTIPGEPMPVVRLSYYECLNGLLPPVCVTCGASAKTGHVFTVQNRVLFYLLGALTWLPPVFLPAVLLARRKRPMTVPMCEPHRARYARWDSATIWSYLVWVGGAFTAALVLFVLAPSGPEDHLALVATGYWAATTAWLVLVALLQVRYPRTTQATARGIRLSGVHADFVRAVHADRAADPNPDRRLAFGDERDDYDDEAETTLPVAGPPPGASHDQATGGP